MGIKGIYEQLEGTRVSLAKLSADKLQETGRPLRLAIDFQIWQFQTNAATGGANPGIRTLFFRCIRLLRLGIQPIFVFDGSQKPDFKRGRHSSRRGGPAIGTGQAKELLRRFGFRVHQAPGEAEAECALLQRVGVVDAVLSEDVDTVMFGCTRTLRNWSSRAGTSAGEPTHVTMYSADPVTGLVSGLDREGMVLVALLSGGDYNVEGVPGFGIGITCRAARAGFGRSLCRVRSSDPGSRGFRDWRDALRHELATDERGVFGVKRKALEIPDDFPDVGILQCYTHPVVSDRAAIEQLRSRIDWWKRPDVEGLREFAWKTFDWCSHGSFLRFVHLMAPALLVFRLLSSSAAAAAASAAGPPSKRGIKIKEEEENVEDLIEKIGLQRTHVSADGVPELRASYIPLEVVGMRTDPDRPAQDGDETLPWGRTGLSVTSVDEGEDGAEEDLSFLGEPPTTDPLEASGVPAKFDPQQPTPMWVLRPVLELGAPFAMRDWEAAQEEKLKGAKGRKRKGRAKKEVPEAGAMLKYIQITRPPKSAEGGMETPKARTANTISAPRLGKQITLESFCLAAVSSTKSRTETAPPFSSSYLGPTVSARTGSPTPLHRTATVTDPAAAAAHEASWTAAKGIHFVDFAGITNGSSEAIQKGSKDVRAPDSPPAWCRRRRRSNSTSDPFGCAAAPLGAFALQASASLMNARTLKGSAAAAANSPTNKRELEKMGGDRIAKHQKTAHTAIRDQKSIVQFAAVAKTRTMVFDEEFYK